MRERSDGVWELRVFVGRDRITGKPRQKSKTHRGSERSAQTALAKLVTEVADGKHGGTNASVDDLLTAWLKDAERNTSPATMAVYRASVKSHLKPALGHLKVSKLGVHDLDELYRAMGERGVSVYVIRQAHSAIRAALSAGQRWSWVTQNVATLARPPKVPQGEVVAATSDQVRRLIVRLELTDPDLAHIVLLAALTGCRRGELCALRWDDWDGDRLHVRRRRIESEGHVTEHAGTKGGKGKRIVIDELGIATLARLKALQEARATEAGTKLPKNGYLLSTEGLGVTPRRPKNVSSAVGEAARAIGMPEIHLHSLRHYAATELIASGQDVRTVAERLGHADPALTLRVYSHVIEAREREAASVLGRALAPTPEELS